MAERWYYKHAGERRGPVTLKKLEELAAIGGVLANDPVWREGDDPLAAVEALMVLDVDCFGRVMAAVSESFAPKPPATNEAPDWVAEAPPGAAPPDSEAPVTVEPAAAPDWLGDVDTGPKKPLSPPLPPNVANSRPSMPPPVSNKPKPKRVRAASSTSEVEIEVEEEAPEPFEFKRRDLLVFGLGGLTVVFAVVLGVILAKYTFAKRDPVEPVPQPQPQLLPQPQPQPDPQPQPEPKNDVEEAK